MAVIVQDIYKCDSCQFASDYYGNGCKFGDLFPVLLILSDSSNCENYKFDAEKVEQQLKNNYESNRINK